MTRDTDADCMGPATDADSSVPLLYGHPDSGHACKIALALRLLEQPHRCEVIDIWAPPATRPAAFRRVSPFGEVPVLVLDGQALFQSGNILLALAERSGRLGGESAESLARARALLFWEANRIGMVLPQLLEAARQEGAGFPPGALAWLDERWQGDIARLETLLKDAPFLGGAAPSIADIAVWGYLDRHEAAGLRLPPGADAWLARMRALPHQAPAAALFPPLWSPNAV